MSFEPGLRLFRVCRYLLPTQNLPRASFISDQRIPPAARLLRLQLPAQFLGRRLRRGEDQLTEQLRVFQRRRLQQARQTRKNRVFLIASDDNLHQHLAGGLASENPLYPFKARQRVLAITLRNTLVFPCIEQHALTVRKQRPQFPDVNLR